MNTAVVVLLALTALATVTMAVIQIRLIVVASRLARRVDQLTAKLEQDVRPLISRVQAIVEDTATLTTMAVTQMDRADHLVAEFTRRAEDTMNSLQRTLLAPAREGKAVMAGVGAAIAAFRELRRDRRSGADEEDPLFIG